ncbi:hypothetical protein O7599_19190 [Streptomyces sp. WMMC500]|uniref:putative T7SS-secreted protein n=1 Tax=Streptomyces sp. WMMC500 TaxID=3015154 RepID=UPI00248C7334|nr:hypothetical protein [Streptomyces sp. WMMC500]WBB57807.1 hypothetical protein O7599_19190 [Streptomyces sp. WMMC500]
MTAEAAADYPALGFVPCPGDQSVASDVAGTVRGTARALGEVQQVLHGTGVGDWKGKAAEAFRDTFDGDFRPKIDEACESFRQAADALSHWADFMLRGQYDARVLEGRAAEAQSAVEQANRRLGALDDANRGGDERSRLDAAEQERSEQEQERAERELRTARGAVSSAEAELETIRSRARGLRDSYREEGKSVAERLHSAMKIAPNEPGLLDKLGDAIGDLGNVLGGLVEAVGDMLDAVADWIKEHADWITVLAAVVGIAAIFFPGLALLAFALSAVAFLAHASKYGISGLFPPSRDNIGNWLTLGGDALGMVPGIGPVARGAVTGLRAARGTAGVASSVRVGISTGARVTQSAARGVNPAIPGIVRPVEGLATRLGMSRAAAMNVADGVQAGVTGLLTAPTAINAANPTDQNASNANYATGTANMVTGSGGGKFGVATAIASGVGLVGWGTR